MTTLDRSPLLLIDGDNLVHRCAHALSAMRNDEGVFVGGVFGSVTALTGYVNAFLGHVPIIVWDDKSKGRKSLYPAYKAHRVQDEFRSEIDRNILITRRLLRIAGYISVYVPGHEADDLIAWLAKHNPCTIVSTDKDFFQLLTYPNTLIFRGRRLNVTYNYTTFTRDYGVTPDQFRISLAMSGDANDGVRGVPGVGEVKKGKGGVAKDILSLLPREMFDLPPCWDLFVDSLYPYGKKKKRIQAVIDNVEKVIENYAITELVTDRFVPPTVQQMVCDQVREGFTGVRKSEFYSRLFELDNSGVSEDDCTAIDAAIRYCNRDASGVCFGEAE